MCKEDGASGQDSRRGQHGSPYDQASRRSRTHEARQEPQPHIREGRSDKAAKLHSVTRATTSRDVDESSPGVGRSIPGGDIWAERGEHGRWVRVHVTPRLSMFYPEEVPRVPGRKTIFRATRKVQDIYLSGERFKMESDWTVGSPDDVLDESWTCRTIFIVARIHSSDHRTDQSREDRDRNHLIEEEFPGRVRLIETTNPEVSIDGDS